MQELEKPGISLEATTETVDNSEVGKLVFDIKGYVAKLDAERRRDATGRGKRARRKSGKLPPGTGQYGCLPHFWRLSKKTRNFACPPIVPQFKNPPVARRIIDSAVLKIMGYSDQ